MYIATHKIGQVRQRVYKMQVMIKKLTVYAGTAATGVALLPGWVLADCARGVKVSTIFSRPGSVPGDECIGNDRNPIFDFVGGYVLPIFAGVIGLLLVLVIVVSGIQYIIAGGSSDNTREAKNRLKGAVTGLLLYIMMFGILQVLLPPDARIFR